jgi:spore germination protein KA
MMKDLTLRPHTRKVRKAPQQSLDQEWEKPLNVKQIREELSKSSDIIFRDFTIRAKEEIQCTLGVVDGIVDKHMLDNYILRVLMVESLNDPDLQRMTYSNAHEILLKLLTPINEIRLVKRTGEAIDAVLSGSAVLFIGDTQVAIAVGVRLVPSRSISEPQTESTIRGPKEGFNESARFSTALLRKRIKNPLFRLVSMKIGDMTKTDVTIAYIENLASPDVVSEVIKRLGRIKTGALASGDILEEFIEDFPYSPFPQIHHTERPDIASANLLEGRVAIIVDGTPTVLIVPVTLAGFMQVNEDYYERAMIVVLIRFIRYLGAVVAIMAPSIYIAVTTFHQELLPTSLAMSIAAGREATPFPALIEALLMLFVLEILQEAGLRLPKPIGQTIGIVGALVIGDAAVKASLVSPIMVIIIGITAVSSYAIPAYDLAIAVRLTRFPLMILAGTMGFLGIGVGLYAGLIHLLGLRSFGTPYMSPIAPLRIRAFLQDTFVRAPWWAMKRRPELIDTDNPKGGK